MTTTTRQISKDQYLAIEPQLRAIQMDVLAMLQAYGKSTTRELANLMDVDLLTVRPRVTELQQLGLVTLCDRRGGEGVYRTLSIQEIEAREKAARGTGQETGVQTELF